MLKLLLCILCISLLALTLLQVRQQRLELSFQVNRLHARVKASQARLWSQQLQIAVYTAPNSIRQTVGQHELNMVPQLSPGELREGSLIP
jgi:hypothetical protein